MTSAQIIFGAPGGWCERHAGRIVAVTFALIGFVEPLIDALVWAVLP